jgi:hypothetical protein
MEITAHKTTTGESQQTPSHTVITSHKSGWLYGVQMIAISLNALTGCKEFAVDSKVKQSVTSCLLTLDTDFFYAGIQALVPWWVKHLNTCAMYKSKSE